MISEKIIPEVTIGIVGHIDHGKTTLLEKLTGKWTDTHSEELKRGITIRLGYASCVIRKCTECKGPSAYTTSKKCMKHNKKTKVQRRISFVDAPGHETLMTTMLSGASIIHGAILVIAANESVPQQQTKDHLKALEITGIKNIIIVQNKVDLVSKKELKKNYEEIKAFVKGTIAEKACIIPVSAQAGVNVDALLQAIEEFIPSLDKEEDKNPIMLVARSFDVNKPGKEVSELTGSVLGGALKQGVLKKNDEIVILPGLKKVEKNVDVWKPIHTKIKNLNYSNFFVDEVKKGGSFGLSTNLDPYYAQSDKLAGSVVCLKNKPIPVMHELKLKIKMLEGEEVKINDVLLINAWTSRTTGVVGKKVDDEIHISLKLPIAIVKGERVALSLRQSNRWKLSGWGEIV